MQGFQCNIAQVLQVRQGVELIEDAEPITVVKRLRSDGSLVISVHAPTPEALPLAAIDVKYLEPISCSLVTCHDAAVVKVFHMQILKGLAESYFLPPEKDLSCGPDIIKSQM